MTSQPRSDHLHLPDQPAHRRGRLNVYLCLFLVSLAVRAALWIPVSMSGMTTMYDEGAYLTRAVGYGNVVSALLTGEIPEQADYNWAYRNGGWPPLHPLLIGLAFAAFGPGVALARLVVVMQSALTTCVVYALTRRLANQRAARYAAGIHILYPSFLAYSHLLWSESTYVLVCLSTLYFTVRAVETSLSGKRQFLFILLAGLSLGLAGLTRAAVLPLLLVIPAWQMWKIKPGVGRFLLPGTTLLVALATISPWMATLWNRESRFVLLSTAAGYNLYLGNNPWSQEDQARHEARGRLQEYMKENNVSRDEAGRALALAYIRSNPAGFVVRCWQHTRAMCVPDWYVLRHMLYATYPPLPAVLGPLIIILLFGTMTILISCVTYGFCENSSAFMHRGLLAFCVAFGMLPSLPTIANSRMMFPLLAILLPAAGVGLAAIIGQRRWIVGTLILVIAAVSLRSVNPSLPQGAFGTRNQASTHYASSATMLERFFGAQQIAGKDRIMLRYNGPEVAANVTLTLVGGKHVFQDSNSPQATWSIKKNKGVIGFDIITTDATVGTPTIQLLYPKGDRLISFEPVHSDAWRRWQPTGSEHFEYTWLGAAGITDERVSLLLQK